MPEYEFTEDWFSPNIPEWERLFDEIKPRCVLEIGSYEGRSTVWMAEKMNAAGGAITCVDTFMDDKVLERFRRNIEIAKSSFKSIFISPYMKEKSSTVMSVFRAQDDKFDFIYIDGSHKACDVLSDAVDAFHLCKKGGVIVFDDYYAGDERENTLEFPKLAIDAFVTCFEGAVEMVSIGRQMVVRKK